MGTSQQLSSRSLQQLIIERIQREGPITFAAYMRMALYEPGYGYYMTGPTRMGWEGDYYTSTDISPLFAHCMARQLQQMWEQLGQPAPFTILEQGAGRGDLGREIRSWAAQESSPFHGALNYHTSDIHTGRDALQRVSTDVPEADAIPKGHTVNRVPTPRAINCSSPSPTPSVIISNELVDAFPVHIVQKHDDKLYE